MDRTFPGPVMVTGATGYVGAALVTRLVAEGHDVRALVRPASSLEPLAPVLDRIGLLTDDGNTGRLATAVQSFKPAVCFHLAAHSVPQRGINDVDTLIDSNFRLGVRLAEALAATPESVVIINAGSIWQLAGDSGRPAGLYAATKQALEDVLRSYADDGRLRVASLIIGHIGGPNDKRGWFIKLLADAALSGVPLDASPGEQLIDLVHRDDVVDALVAAADYMSTSNAAWRKFAVSSGVPVSLRDLAVVVENVLQRPVPVQWGARQYRPIEMFTNKLSGIDTVPEWSPTHSLADIVRSVVSGQSRLSPTGQSA